MSGMVVCDIVVLSVVKVCVECGGVNVFHVCHDFCVVYGVVFLQYVVVVGPTPPPKNGGGVQ